MTQNVQRALKGQSVNMWAFKLYFQCTSYHQVWNLKISWITNYQLRRSVSTIPCFYLRAHCILGVVVCLNGLSGLLPAACTSGTGVPYKTEPHLSLWQTSSSSASVLLDPWTADYTTPLPPLPRTFMLLHAAKKLSDELHLHIDRHGQKT